MSQAHAALRQQYLEQKRELAALKASAIIRELTLTGLTLSKGPMSALADAIREQQV